MATTRRKSTTKKRTSSKATSRIAAKGVVEVDLSDVESRGGAKGGGGKRYPEADYAVKVMKAEVTKSRDKQTPEVKITYKITQGAHKGGTIIDDLYLTPGAMWRYRQTLEAMGIKIPKGKFKLEVMKLKNRELAVTLSDDEYDGKIRSRVTDMFKLAEFELDEDDEDEDDDESEDEEEEEEEDEDDEDDEEEEDDDADEDEEEDDLEDLDLDDL